MGEVLKNPRHVLMKVKFSRNQQKEPFDGQCRRGSTDAELRSCGIFGRDDKIFGGRTGRWEEEVRRCIGMEQQSRETTQISPTQLFASIYVFIGGMTCTRVGASRVRRIWLEHGHLKLKRMMDGRPRSMS